MHYALQSAQKVHEEFGISERKRERERRGDRREIFLHLRRGERGSAWGRGTPIFMETIKFAGTHDPRAERRREARRARGRARLDERDRARVGRRAMLSRGR